jgi:integrase
MLIALTQAISVSGKYVTTRPNSAFFWFDRKVPADLRTRFGKLHLRESLETTDKLEAIRRADAVNKTYEAQFKALRSDPAMTPADTLRAGLALAKEWGDLDTFVDHYADAKLHRYIADRGMDQGEAPDVPLKRFLSPVDLAALAALQRGPNTKRMSDAFAVYRDTHRKAHDAAFLAKVQRDWDGLVALVGNIPVDDLTRQHGLDYIAGRLKTVKTTSVRRSLSNINAVLNKAWREWQSATPQPFDRLDIPSEGNDIEPRAVPTMAQVKSMADRFKGDDRSTSLLVLLHIGTGARIAELSGLAAADIKIDDKTPHINLVEHPWRSFKNKSGVRVVPLTGVALEAAKTALSRAEAAKSATLFPEYARERGNDAASAAVNRRLAEWGTTSHGFRHWLKDALREVGCPKDVRDAIQGHATKDAADNYGKGHDLKTKLRWLNKVDALLSATTPPQRETP